MILYETFGKTLPEGNPPAVVQTLVMAVAQTLVMKEPEPVRAAGFECDGPALGNAVSGAILDNPPSVVIAREGYAETFDRIHTDDRRIALVIPELIEEPMALVDEEPPSLDGESPFILVAGKRRTNSASTIYRDPSWRRKDRAGTLRMSLGNAKRLGVAEDGYVRVSTERGSIETAIEITDALRDGYVTHAHGMGLAYPNEKGEREVVGVPPNELTSSDDRDWIAGTSWNKHVRARVEAVA